MKERKQNENYKTNKKPNKVILGDIAIGTTFTFPENHRINMLIPLKSEQLFNATKDEFVDLIVAYEMDLYALADEIDEILDEEYYLSSQNNRQNLCVYIDLSSGYIYCSHQYEEIIPVEAELIYEI